MRCSFVSLSANPNNRLSSGSPIMNRLLLVYTYENRKWGGKGEINRPCLDYIPHLSCVPHVSHVLHPPSSITLPSLHIGQVSPSSTPTSAVSSTCSSSSSLSSPRERTCESLEPST